MAGLPNKEEFLSSLQSIPCKDLKRSCDICCEDFTSMATSVAVRMPCDDNHIFCREDIEAWVQTDTKDDVSSCPKCRAPLCRHPDRVPARVLRDYYRLLALLQARRVVMPMHDFAHIYGWLEFREFHNEIVLHNLIAFVQLLFRMLQTSLEDRSLQAAAARAAYITAIEQWCPLPPTHWWPEEIEIRTQFPWPPVYDDEDEYLDDLTTHENPVAREYYMYREHELMLERYIRERKGGTIQSRVFEQDLREIMTRAVSQRHDEGSEETPRPSTVEEEMEYFNPLIQAIVRRQIWSQMGLDSIFRIMRGLSEGYGRRWREEDIMAEARQAAEFAARIRPNENPYQDRTLALRRWRRRHSRELSPGAMAELAVPEQAVRTSPVQERRWFVRLQNYFQRDQVANEQPEHE